MIAEAHARLARLEARRLQLRLQLLGCTIQAKAGQLLVGPRRLLTQETQAEIALLREALLAIA